MLNGPMVLTALPDAATAAPREAGWLQGQGQIQDGGDLAWQAWSWLPGTTAPAWEYPDGALGTAKSALMLVQLAGAVGEGVDAYAQGRTADAALAVVNVAMAGFHALGPCTAGVLVGKLAGSKAVGASASALVGTVAAWSARGVGALGAAVGGVNAIERIRSGDIIGGALGLLQSGADLVAVANSCFTGETRILTRLGWIRMDELTVLDEVASAAEHDPNGAIEFKRVQEVYHFAPARIWHIHVQGRVIRTTVEHPFYVWGKGWVAAAELVAGDLFRSDNGRMAVVEEVFDSGVEEEVYNCSVEDHHTYFVGDSSWGFSVWAHNTRCGETVHADPERLGYNNGATHIDHARARALGGTNDPSNLRPLAAETNSARVVTKVRWSEIGRGIAKQG